MALTSQETTFSPEGGFFVAATVVVVTPNVVGVAELSVAATLESTLADLAPQALSAMMRNAGTRRFTPTSLLVVPAIHITYAWVVTSSSSSRRRRAMMNQKIMIPRPRAMTQYSQVLLADFARFTGNSIV